MPENSSESSPPAHGLHQPPFTAQWAGLGARAIAYLIDILPITLVMVAIFYLFFGFDQTAQQYFNSRDDINARIHFLQQRNQIRDLSFLLYIIYGTFTEGSAMQGTLGKRLMGLRVTDNNGNPLSMGRACGRNAAKLISYIPLGLGFIWAIGSKRKRAWHDMIAKTLVIKP